VTAPAGTTDPTGSNNTATDTDTLTPQADLAITKTGPSTATAGTPISYTLTVKNTGPSDATSVTVTDTIAASMINSSYTVNGGTSMSPWPGSLPLGTRSAGSTTIIVITATPTLAATTTNQASVASTTFDPNLGNNSSTVVSTNVGPGPATHFSVAAPTSVTSNVAFNFTVTALDAFNNTATGYTGTVHFPSTDGDVATVLPADYTFTATDAGTHSFSAKLQTVGPQTITATDTAYPIITGTTSIAVGPNALLGQVATTDADFKNADGFDVLFTKGNVTNQLKLKNTNPGTFHYLLTLTNETGATIHDNTVLNYANGATASVILTVPALPTSVGTTIPSSALGFTMNSTSAFWAQGSKSINAHPDDKTDSMPVSVYYTTSAPGGDCSAVSSWTSGQPADGTIVKCIKITGFSIPKHHSAKIDVSYEFALKNTDGWSANAQAMFRAGFAFKSTTNVHLDFPIGSNTSGNYTGNQAAGLVGAGQQVTAVGGFVFDTQGNGVGGRTVKLYNSQVADCSGPGVGSTTTQLDGFYFIWKTGPNQLATDPNLPSGVAYYEAVCSTPTGPFTVARYINHKLSNKEFDEEDFYITP
jgi:uncharacterized repeat protein (TIGR01451 family)